MEKLEVEITKLNNLLQEALDLYKKDREMAIKNYQSLETQLNRVHQIMEYSEEGILEKEKNKALDLVIKTGTRLDKMVEIVSKLVGTHLTNISRENVAKLAIENNPVNKPVDISRLLQ